MLSREIFPASFRRLLTRLEDPEIKHDCQQVVRGLRETLTRLKVSVDLRLESDQISWVQHQWWHWCQTERTDTLEAEATNFLSAPTDTSVTQSVWPCDAENKTRLTNKHDSFHLRTINTEVWPAHLQGESLAQGRHIPECNSLVVGARRQQGCYGNTTGSVSLDMKYEAESLLSEPINQELLLKPNTLRPSCIIIIIIINFICMAPFIRIRWGPRWKRAKAVWVNIFHHALLVQCTLSGSP